MIPVAEAVTRITDALDVLPAETVGLDAGLGRVLAEDVRARRTQPPFAVSAMDGYAVRADDIRKVPVVLRQVGAVPAGQKFEGRVGAGETVRIFTGARMPDGADTIVIQEDTTTDDDAISVLTSSSLGTYVRAAGLDFSEGEVGLLSGVRLTARSLGLIAAMNVPWLRVRRRPRVAILSTGDEIVMPGDPVGENQIVSSNGNSLVAAVRSFGGDPVQIGIAGDNRKSLLAMISAARGTDLLVTTGGASVGEHDLIREVLGEAGMDLDFWRIAMRPGKPLMFGKLGDTPVLGLPGNPVSSLICAQIFLRPALIRMLGATLDDVALNGRARLTRALPQNDQREDYIRARLATAPDGTLEVEPFSRQDSSMGSLLAHANALVVRQPRAEAAEVGDVVDIMCLDQGTPTI